MIALDIETITNAAFYNANEVEIDAWLERKDRGAEVLGLHPPFAQIVAIAWREGKGVVQAVAGPDEAHLLDEFFAYLDGSESPLMGHNLKRFDLPMLAFRALANGIELPHQLQVAGKKPWEITNIDTMDLLTFGGGPWVSLEHACLAFGLPNPKEAVDGSKVAEMAEAGQWEEIAEYCKGDVEATIRLYNHLFKLGAT